MTPEQAQQLAAARADAYDAHVHAKAAASTAAAARTEAYNAHVWAKHASAQTAALAAVVGALAANPDLTAADVEAAAAAGASRALAEAVIEVNVNIPGETA